MHILTRKGKMFVENKINKLAAVSLQRTLELIDTCIFYDDNRKDKLSRKTKYTESKFQLKVYVLERSNYNRYPWNKMKSISD
ncbi:hypothetical protein GJ496_009724 [Pomphorhynchus laevis]|nr:hypothetical protein GJ496_009724 [Pomphorhynchus laevis]